MVHVQTSHTHNKSASYRVHTFTFLMKAVELICTVCGEEGELETVAENRMIWKVCSAHCGGAGKKECQGRERNDGGLRANTNKNWTAKEGERKRDE